MDLLPARRRGDRGRRGAADGGLIVGLRIGADDYIKKPFSQKLLIERIRAVLRRRAQTTESDTPEQLVRQPQRPARVRLRDRVDHIESHLDCALRVIGARLRQTADTVITITKNLNS